MTRYRVGGLQLQLEAKCLPRLVSFVYPAPVPLVSCGESEDAVGALRNRGQKFTDTPALRLRIKFPHDPPKETQRTPEGTPKGTPDRLTAPKNTPRAAPDRLLVVILGHT